MNARPPSANIRVPSMPPCADERDVGRAAADVDEQRAGLADLLVAEHARDRVRLGDDLEQLQVQLRGDASGARRGGPAARTR